MHLQANISTATRNLRRNDGEWLDGAGQPNPWEVVAAEQSTRSVVNSFTRWYIPMAVSVGQGGGGGGGGGGRENQTCTRDLVTRGDIEFGDRSSRMQQGGDYSDDSDLEDYDCVDDTRTLTLLDTDDDIAFVEDECREENSRRLCTRTSRAHRTRTTESSIIRVLRVRRRRYENAESNNALVASTMALRRIALEAGLEATMMG
jgi:hypothetical protein